MHPIEIQLFSLSVQCWSGDQLAQVAAFVGLPTNKLPIITNMYL
jgi:hypothetical protein